MIHLVFLYLKCQYILIPVHFLINFDIQAFGVSHYDDSFGALIHVARTHAKERGMQLGGNGANVVAFPEKCLTSGIFHFRLGFPELTQNPSFTRRTIRHRRFKVRRNYCSASPTRKMSCLGWRELRSGPPSLKETTRFRLIEPASVFGSSVFLFTMALLPRRSNQKLFDLRNSAARIAGGLAEKDGFA